VDPLEILREKNTTLMKNQMHNKLNVFE
jgi:hypothetical protein